MTTGGICGLSYLCGVFCLPCITGVPRMRAWSLLSNSVYVEKKPSYRLSKKNHIFRRVNSNSSRVAWGPSPAASSAGPDVDDGTDVDVDVLLRKAVNLISTSNSLLPYDSREVNLALVIWQAIREVPEGQRPQLVGLLNSICIRRLWLVSGERYAAHPSQVATTIGPEYSLWADLPDSAEQLVHLCGKAALPLHFLRWNSFGASFFLHPETEDPFARLAVLVPPVRDLLYPLYCRVSVGQDIVPGSEELCDMVLSFTPARDLGLAPEDVPRSMWPRPRDPLPPFDQQLTAYVRAAGPGLLVGKALQLGKAGPAPPVYFVAAKKGVEVLV